MRGRANQALEATAARLLGDDAFGFMKVLGHSMSAGSVAVAHSSRSHAMKPVLTGLTLAIVVCGCSQLRTADEKQEICANNLRQIVAAKVGYSIEHGFREGEPITPQQVDDYIKGGWEALKCPSGGKYTVGVAASPFDKTQPGTEAQAPRCTVHGSAARLIANKTVQRTGTSRFAEETNRTSSAAGSRR